MYEGGPHTASTARHSFECMFSVLGDSGPLQRTQAAAVTVVGSMNVFCTVHVTTSSATCAAETFSVFPTSGSWSGFCHPFGLDSSCPTLCQVMTGGIRVGCLWSGLCLPALGNVLGQELMHSRNETHHLLSSQMSHQLPWPPRDCSQGLLRADPSPLPLATGPELVPV